MRVAIYTQVIANGWVIVVNDRPLLKSLYRGYLVTSLSFTIAFIFGEAQQSYSTQEQWVAILLIGMIVLSTNCTGLAILFGLIDENGQNSILDTMTIIVTLPVTIALFVAAICRKSTWIAIGCTRFQYSIRATLIVRWLSYTTLSLLSLTGLLSLIAIIHLRCSTIQYEIQKRRWFRIVSVCWILTLMFTMATAEFLMNAAFYEENDGSRIALRASTWGLGQVMTVVMVASFIWEIANFYSKRRQVSLDNFSLQWMRCGWFRSQNTPPDGRQDVEMERPQHNDVVNTSTDVTARQSDDTGRMRT